MSEPRVIIEEQGPCWIVTLNAPERRNALGRAVVGGDRRTLLLTGQPHMLQAFDVARDACAGEVEVARGNALRHVTDGGARTVVPLAAGAGSVLGTLDARM